MSSKFLALAFLLTSMQSRADWELYLDGTELPTTPWAVFQDGAANGATLIDFVDPKDGSANHAIRITSDAGAYEWYVELFPREEVTAGARFRVTDVSATGKENLLCVTTRAKHLAPCPSLTIVDGRFKLWNYVLADTELMDIAPVDLNLFHTVYLYARSDGLVKFWWDGKLIFDGMAPRVNPYDGYVEWGSGSWQYDATDTTEWDWVGHGSPTNLPLSVLTTPAHGAIFADPTQGWKASILTQAGLAPGVAANGITLTVNGVDKTSDITITGNNEAREVVFNKLTTNQVYKLVLTVTDLSGTNSVYPFEFDTYSSHYFTFEAEDFNFDGGGFLDTIVLASAEAENNYLNRFATDDVDVKELSTEFSQSGHAYRSGILVGTEKTRDAARPNYEAARVADPTISDYNVGWVEPTEWLNYTRTFPAGDYNIYARMAADIGAPFSATLGKVTDPTLATQTETVLGSFKGAAGRGWQTYDFVPLTDANGDLVKVALNGLTTLRTTAETGFNANFYMLTPAVANLPRLFIERVGNQLRISWNDTGFTLESSGQPNTGWQTVIGVSNPFLFTPGPASQFYRLKQ